MVHQPSQLILVPELQLQAVVVESGGALGGAGGRQAGELGGVCHV